MEVFVQLEAKILQLVSLVKTLKDENTQLTEKSCFLAEEILSLKSQVEALENSLLAGNENAVELDHEREITKLIVMDLMKSMESLELSEQPAPAPADVASECER